MKKFMKVCAIMIAVIFAIGVILVTVAGCGGGFRALSYQIMHGDLHFGPDDDWGIDWGVVGDILDDHDLDMDDIFSEAYEVIRDQSTYETVFGAAAVRNLELELGGCTVTLTASPDADYHVLAKKISAFQTYVEGDTLHVKGLKTGKWNLGTGMAVTVQIPAGTVFHEAELALGAGDFTIEDLQADEVEVSLGAGRLQVGFLKTGEFTCEVGAGQIIVDEGQFAGDVALSVGAGEMLITGSIPGNLEAECGMGNVEIEVLGSTEEDHNYEMECAAGNLTAGSRSVAGLVSEQSINNGAASTYNLTCAMGNMEVRFK